MRLTLIEPGHEAEVAGATLESLPEVGILLSVGVDNGPIAEDDLEVVDVIRSEALSVGVERVLGSCQSLGSYKRADHGSILASSTYAATSGESTNTDDRGAAADGHDARGNESAEDGTPVGTRLDGCQLSLRVVDSRVHVAWGVSQEVDLSSRDIPKSTVTPSSMPLDPLKAEWAPLRMPKGH